MKYLITTILLLLNDLLVFGQDNLSGNLFQTNSSTRLYYVDFNKSVVYVYAMGKYLDKAGTGYSIRHTDTLIRQPNDSYLGKDIKIINENSKFFLVAEFKKPKKFPIDVVKNSEVVNNNLNNAYYLDNYFKMCDSLNKTYPLNHHTFRNGFYTWKDLQNKEIYYLQFRNFANKRLKEIKDSISSRQESYVTLTNYIIQNVRTFDYNIFKDSLLKLPADFRYLSWYYGTVINEAAKQRPEYFFRLAEDFPNNRSLIFSAVEDNKEVIQGLKTVERHNEIKKEFFKDRRFGKTMPYKIIGTYAIVIGSIILLIATQK